MPDDVQRDAPARRARAARGAADGLLRRRLELAERQIRANWAAVEAVATALLQATELSPAETYCLIERSLPETTRAQVQALADRIAHEPTFSDLVAQARRSGPPVYTEYVGYASPERMITLVLYNYSAEFLVMLAIKDPSFGGHIVRDSLKGKWTKEGPYLRLQASDGLLLTYRFNPRRVRVQGREAVVEGYDWVSSSSLTFADSVILLAQDK